MISLKHTGLFKMYQKLSSRFCNVTSMLKGIMAELSPIVLLARLLVLCMFHYEISLEVLGLPARSATIGSTALVPPPPALVFAAAVFEKASYTR